MVRDVYEKKIYFCVFWEQSTPIHQITDNLRLEFNSLLSSDVELNNGYWLHTSGWTSPVCHQVYLIVIVYISWTDLFALTIVKGFDLNA